MLNALGMGVESIARPEQKVWHRPGNKTVRLELEDLRERKKSTVNLPASLTEVRKQYF